jgi:hypothetical protein
MRFARFGLLACIRFFSKYWVFSIMYLYIFGTFGGPQAYAQDLAGLEQGIKPYGSYHGGDIDSISMVNGNLALNIPLDLVASTRRQTAPGIPPDLHEPCLHADGQSR